MEESRKLTKRMRIKGLAEEYLSDKNYHWGIINEEWQKRLTDELSLRTLSDEELSDIWDFVAMTLDCEIYVNMINEDRTKATRYMDCKGAFVEVINSEARRRREIDY